MSTDRMDMTDIGDSLSVGVSRDHERVCLFGELDMASAGALERQISAIGEESPSERMVVDLSELRYVDSSGLDALLNIARRASSRRFQLELTPGNAGVQRIFELTGLDRVLPFRENSEPAPLLT